MAKNIKGGGHIKQISFKLFTDDVSNINRIMKEQGFAFEADALRYALELEKRNSLLEIRLSAMEGSLKAQTEAIQSFSWKNNDVFNLLMKIARFFKIIPAEGN